jgi:hypothetical protein
MATGTAGIAALDGTADGIAGSDGMAAGTAGAASNMRAGTIAGDKLDASPG